MQPSDTLKTTVISFEADRRDALDTQKKHIRKRDAYQGEADKMRDSMGWREKHLPRWMAKLVGGNTSAIDRYAAKMDNVSAEDKQARSYGDKADTINSSVINAVSDFLNRNDQNYRNILIPLAAANEFKSSIGKFKGLIRHALSEIDDAQSMETMDMFTKNKGISLMSTFANGDARDAVNRVKSAAPTFEAAAQKYQESYRDFSVGKIEAEFGDLTDLVFDFMFDGFDFMSIFSLSALGSAEDNMEKVQRQVKSIESTVDEQIDQLQSLRDACIAKTRQACTL